MSESDINVNYSPIGRVGVKYTAPQKEKITEAMSDAWIEGASHFLTINLAKLNTAAAGLCRLVKTEFSPINHNDVENFLSQANVVLFYAEKAIEHFEHAKNKLHYNTEILKSYKANHERRSN